METEEFLQDYKMDISELQEQPCYKRVFTIEPKTRLTIKGLPFAYICGTHDADSDAITSIIGIGYGMESSRHKISTIISSDSITYDALDTEYGLIISNNRDYETTVFLVGLF